MRRHGVERQRLEVQPTDLLVRVVAIEAVPTDDGGLLLGIIAEQAAARHKQVGERDRPESSGPHRKRIVFKGASLRAFEARKLGPA
jgi:hypothetical protein